MRDLEQMNDNMKNCIEACNECRDVCEYTLYQHCLEVGGEHVEQQHVKIMADCIEMCQTASHFMLRESDTSAAVCGTCADICESCADSCEEIGSEEMERCAELCRRCSESCREMSSMAGISSAEQIGRNATQKM
jgi:hypothetical protein